ncbi:MAG: LPS export ABC transporter permease LptF [Desulfobacteraceae bacterium 4572_35.1]|nr:MAG: LPS export ABC transporter permease LptF [Desulfobacteraceae bacterium 4572_35.1]
MSAHRIQKYILREVTIPFVLGIALFSFVLLLGKMLKLIELIIDKGVPISQITMLFASLLPSFFVITVPLSFLLGTIIAFSRLSADSEVVAMKAAGFSLYQLAKPVIILSVLVCFFTGWLTLYAEPLGRTSLHQQLIDMAFSKAAVAITPQVFNEKIDGLVLYANKVDPKTGALQNVFISDNRMDQTPAIISAQQGRIYSDSNSKKLLMHLHQGAIHRLQQQESQIYQVIEFNDYDINLSLKEGDQKTKKRAGKISELSTADLMKKIATPSEKKRYKYQAELNERLILPLSPLIFAIIAIPLGIKSHRSSRGGGFASALLVFMTYYLLFSISKTMVLDNGWPAHLSMWTPTLLFFIFSTLLLKYAAKEQPIPGSAAIQKLINNITNYLSRKR